MQCLHIVYVNMLFNYFLGNETLKKIQYLIANQSSNDCNNLYYPCKYMRFYMRLFKQVLFFFCFIQTSLNQTWLQILKRIMIHDVGVRQKMKLLNIAHLLMLTGIHITKLFLIITCYQGPDVLTIFVYSRMLLTYINMGF